MKIGPSLSNSSLPSNPPEQKGTQGVQSDPSYLPDKKFEPLSSTSFLPSSSSSHINPHFFYPPQFYALPNAIPNSQDYQLQSKPIGAGQYAFWTKNGENSPFPYALPFIPPQSNPHNEELLEQLKEVKGFLQALAEKSKEPPFRHYIIRKELN